MAITERLFDKNAYATSFTGEVLSCEKDERGYWVELDQTLFFPEEGGQSPDQGILGGQRVLDVQIEGDCIRHLVETGMEVGSRVEGEIDWKHRFSNMQQHSGEHIFSGTVNRIYGYNNVGFHLSDQIVTMDFDGVLTEEQVDELEDMVNAIIVSNLPIEVSYPSKEELKSLTYRSKIEIEGQVRIVTIPGVDVCACCAPHVRLTGEIGFLKVMSLQNYKGGVRLSILCGQRALEAMRSNTKLISSLTKELTTSSDKIMDSVVKLKNNTISLNNKLMGAKQSLLQIELEKVPVEQEHVLLFEGELEDGVIRAGVNSLVAAHEGLCGIFSGSEEEGYKYIIGSKTVDCKNIANCLREKLNARGGGSPAMIQGFVTASKESIMNLLESNV